MVRCEPLAGDRFVLVEDTCPFGTDAVLLAHFSSMTAS